MNIPAGGDAYDDSELSRLDQAELDVHNPGDFVELLNRRDTLIEQRDHAASCILAAMVLHRPEQPAWLRQNISEPDRIYVRKLLELVHDALTTDDRSQLLTGLRALAAEAIGHADPDERP